MSQLKCVNSLKAATRRIRGVIFVANKSFCDKRDSDGRSEKPNEREEKKSKSDSLLFEQQDEGNPGATEREKEASLKSKLSHECSKLYGKKNIRMLNVNRVLRLNQSDDDMLKNTMYENVGFPSNSAPASDIYVQFSKSDDKKPTDPKPPDSKSKETKTDSSGAKKDTKTAEPSSSKPAASAAPAASKAPAKPGEPATPAAPGAPSKPPKPDAPPIPLGPRPVESIIYRLKKNVDVEPWDLPPPKKGGLKRQEAGEVILHFIPREWFTAFIPKTGITGFGTFLFTTGTFLVSKEYYVLEHEYYTGVSMAILTAGLIKYAGPLVAQYLDKEIKEYEDTINTNKNDWIESIKTNIRQLKLYQLQSQGNLMLVDAKRENVHLQLENEFRKRQMTVYKKVLHILNYHVEVANAHKRINQKNLVQYVMKNVLESITPEIQNQILYMSIENLIVAFAKVGREDEQIKAEENK
ncbi:unnamed protein product [Phyllotreta striolata]|uniref:ATP synthase subunit b n=1 Tax=Phyllotreta striolata TaxID=444603 RepID=A0A9N9TQX7_PHYSR|nr:unnamed protein product [Phyllotreta striolata]